MLLVNSYSLSTSTRRWEFIVCSFSGWSIKRILPKKNEPHFQNQRKFFLRSLIKHVHLSIGMAMLCSHGQMSSLLFLTPYRFHATSTGEISKHKLLQQLSPLLMFIHLTGNRQASFKSVQKKERKASKKQTQKQLETHCLDKKNPWCLTLGDLGRSMVLSSAKLSKVNFISSAEGFLGGRGGGCEGELSYLLIM